MWSDNSGQVSWLRKPKVTQSASGKAEVCVLVCLDMKLLCHPREQLCALGNKVVHKLKGEMFRQSHAKRPRKGMKGFSLLAWGRV